MIRSSIDLGTNTCLLLAVDWDKGRNSIERVLGDHSTIVRLGQGVDGSRRLHPDAMKRTFECLMDYASKLKAYGGDPASARCVATSQARDSVDAPEFFERIRQATGFRFQVISGDDEARLTFVGALLPGMDPARSAVIDIGGGSTEIILASHGKSVDIGSVRFTERFLKSDPVTDEEFWACQAATDLELEKLKDARALAPVGVLLVAVAGTATTLAALQLGLEKFDAARIDGCRLTRGDVHRLVEELKWRSVAERMRMPGLDPKRADVILAGALILWRAMETLGFAELHVSTRGLRYGVLTE